MDAAFLDTGTLATSVDVLKELPLNWSFYKETKPDQTAQRIANATIVVSNKVLLTREILQNSPHLKLICVAATGYNNVDVVAAKSRGIKVCNIPNYSTPSVVQLTLTFILALATNIIPYVEATRAGRWQKSSLFCLLDSPIIELQGKKLGIIGYGNLGKQIATLARAFGMEILIAQHSSKKAAVAGALPLEEVLKQSDFITIHTPLTPETQNLIQKKELALMKPSAFLINTARGGIVNEKDLAEALKNQRIAGAGVDVLTIEPPGKDNPLVQQDVPNLLLTPHVGWASLESRTRLLAILKDNIHSFLEGTPKNLIG